MIRFALAAGVLLAGSTLAFAQKALSCTDFLHARDGSWHSMVDGPVFGPSGAVPMASGAVLRVTDKGKNGELARALNDLCEAR